MRIRFKRAKEIEKFDHVQAAAAAFHLRYEALRTAEPVGDVLLKQSARFAPLGQKRRDALITGIVKGMGHPKILNSDSEYSTFVYAIFREIFMWASLWFVAAAATALGIALDMRRLRVNRIGTSRTGWAVACVCAGPLAAGAYLYQRKAAWRALIDAVWLAVGDASHPVHVRRQRLLALRETGVIGRRVFLACWDELEAQKRLSSLRNQ